MDNPQTLGFEVFPDNEAALRWLASQWNSLNGHAPFIDEESALELVQSIVCGDAAFVPLTGNPDYRQASRLRNLAAQNPDVADLLNRVATAIVYAVRLFGHCPESDTDDSKL